MLIVVYAGANGAGKSTIVSNLNKELELPFINPDMIAKKYFSDIQDEKERYIKYAMPFAENIRTELMKNGMDFSFETVLSHPSKIDFLDAAKKNGYDIYSIFVGTNDPSINVQRVSNRVSNGGHDVPTEKIKERYYKTMENLLNLLHLSSEAVVLDNSGDKPIPVIYKDNDKYFTCNNNIPDWIKRYVIEPIQQNKTIKILDNLNYKPSEGSLLSVINSTIKKTFSNIKEKDKKQSMSEWKNEIATVRNNLDKQHKSNKKDLFKSNKDKNNKTR